jgi:hypothetical protein
MISTTYNSTFPTQFAYHTKYALIKTLKIVKNNTKIVQNRKKSFKIIAKSFAIPSFSLSINYPLPMIECGGKRSATIGVRDERKMQSRSFTDKSARGG